MELDSIIHQLKDQAFELRHNNHEPMYFEAVYKHTPGSTLIQNIEAYFGKACIAPGQTSNFPKAAKKCMKQLGGIRENQFFYFKQIDDNYCMYAAIWPWESNISMMTLKLGEFKSSFFTNLF